MKIIFEKPDKDGRFHAAFTIVANELHICVLLAQKVLLKYVMSFDQVGFTKHDFSTKVEKLPTTPPPQHESTICS